MGLSNNLGKLSNMITSTGSAVGIGTASPSSLLNIIGGELKWGFTSDLGALSYSGGNPMVQSIGATSLLFNTNGSERMRITSTGNVGIGTSSPAQRLVISGSGDQHIGQTSTTGGNAYTIYTNTSRVYLAGLSADLGPHSYIIYDATANAPRMVITSTGQFQIKEAGGTHTTDGLSIINNASQVWNFVNGGDNNLYFGYNTTSKGVFAYTTGVYTALSDKNKKKDFEASTIGLNSILGLKPTLYRMIDEEESIDKHLGFIAQEVKEFIPQAYVESINDEKTFIGLDYQAITATLVKAIQELSAQNQDLKSRLDKAGL